MQPQSSTHPTPFHTPASSRRPSLSSDSLNVRLAWQERVGTVAKWRLMAFALPVTDWRDADASAEPLADGSHPIATKRDGTALCASGGSAQPSPLPGAGNPCHASADAVPRREAVGARSAQLAAERPPLQAARADARAPHAVLTAIRNLYITPPSLYYTVHYSSSADGAYQPASRRRYSKSSAEDCSLPNVIDDDIFRRLQVSAQTLTSSNWPQNRTSCRRVREDG